jgi:hypothetical protein
MAGPFKEGEGLERPVAGREAELSSEAAPSFAVQPSVGRWVLVGPDGLRAGWGLLLWVVIYFLALNIRQAVVDGFHGLRHDAVVTAVDARAQLATPESIAAVGEREGLWAGSGSISIHRASTIAKVRVLSNTVSGCLRTVLFVYGHKLDLILVQRCAQVIQDELSGDGYRLAGDVHVRMRMF